MLKQQISYTRFIDFSNRLLALSLIVLISIGPAFAGITVSNSTGITATGADGVQLIGLSGITATGADGLLTFGPNGITATGADGITATGADGITATGADGYTYTGANGITATGADSLTIQRADGITATGADGITATGADGVTYSLDSIHFYFPSGITATGADGITATGADGITATGADSRQIANANGITATGADGVTISSANGITATGADGRVFTIPTSNLTLTGADLVVVANAQGISITGADSILETGINALTSALSSGSTGIGLQSIDPELAVTLNQLTDDSNVNAIVVYHQLPTESDLCDLNRIGIVGGLRFHSLPILNVTATRSQLIEVSRLPAVRSIYGNRTLTLTSEPEVRATTGVDRAWRDIDLQTSNSNLPLTGRNVTVAVLDTGIDATHPDLADRVVSNVKLADTLSVGVGFNYPINSESLPNTDLVYGHGSFVAGLIGGSGALSNGKFRGVAPGAKLVGLSAGELTLLYVLEGFDYLLSNRTDLNVRVVNCSFSANTVFDVNDPVNIATRMLTDQGVNVVFSAGNTGPGQHTLNPYAVAPWVISVGATDSQGRLASFSSRGDFASALFRPTLVAPGVNVVSTRGSGVVNVTGAEGVANADLQRLNVSEVAYYTTASGTSFSAPQVAGTIALMLEANPSLTPAEIRDILQTTATPLPPYYEYEVGSGMLNTHAAVLQAVFPNRMIGSWRGTVDRGQIRFASSSITTFSGVVQPTSSFETTVPIPSDAVLASVQIGWGPLTSVNDLGLYVYDEAGNLVAQSNVANLPGLTGKSERVTLNLPAAGNWRVKVRNTLGGLGTPQAFTAAVQIGRAQYASMRDAVSLSASLRTEIYQSVRSFTMWPVGANFRPDFAITRSDMATALVLGARVPQYSPASPTYSDVRDISTMSFVESAQSSPTGPLFVDVVAGGRFRPNDNVTRLAAAVALVRVAGLRSEAEAKANAPLAFLDALTIPAELRGYVAVAVSRGLVQSDSFFRPQNSFSRAELAHAIALIENQNTQ
ncbi:MAG TPA: S8 family serine peptidase [Pyrinomonadaceae bacterium]